MLQSARRAVPPAGEAQHGGAGRGRRVTDGIVKIYLLSIDRRRFFFYADESEPPDDRPERERSVRAGPVGMAGLAAGPLAAAASRSGSNPRRAPSDGRARPGTGCIPGPTRTRRCWSRLRSARRIELHHPASRDAEEVRSLWRDYLNHRWWRHLLWMSANGIVAPPALLFLWPLPGPNVIGYWFAYRAVHHAMIVWGIRRVRRGRIELELRPVAELDWPIEVDDDGQGQARRARRRGTAPGGARGLDRERAVRYRRARTSAAGLPAGRSERRGERGILKTSEHASSQLQHPQGDRRPRPPLPPRADHPGHRGP